MMLRFKPDVRISFVDSVHTDVLGAASLWSLRAGIHVRVNSIEDSLQVHGDTSLHRFGRAWDFGVDSESAVDRGNLAEFLRALLPPMYDVRLETTHVHVEHDGGWNRGIARAQR